VILRLRLQRRRVGLSSGCESWWLAFPHLRGAFYPLQQIWSIEIHGLFGIASGDSGGSNDNSFNPTFGHRYDGLERAGFGNSYGASLYDAMPSSSYGVGFLSLGLWASAPAPRGFG